MMYSDVGLLDLDTLYEVIKPEPAKKFYALMLSGISRLDCHPPFASVSRTGLRKASHSPAACIPEVASSSTPHANIRP